MGGFYGVRDKKIEAFFENLSPTAKVRLKLEDLPPSVKNMTLNELLKNCSDLHRPDAYVENVYMYDLLDVVLAHESLGTERLAFADILDKELLKPLGVKEATFTPEKTALLTQDRVLTNANTGTISEPGILRQGCGTLYMHAADETQFVRALMQPALISTDGRCLVTMQQMSSFVSAKADNVSEATGGLRFRERPLSLSVEKGGSFDNYSHLFRCEKMKDALRLNEAVGAVMLNNFLGIDIPFLRVFNDLYETTIATLQESASPIERSVFRIPDEEPELPLGQGSMKDSVKLFKGTRGFFGYTPKKFLNWSGTAYKIFTDETGKNEYIMHRKNPLRVQFYEKEGLSYLSLGGDSIAPEVKDRSKILEAETKEQDVLDLKDAKALFPRLVGTYDGDHRQGLKNIHITEGPQGVLHLDQIESGSSSLQIVGVLRDKVDGEITEIHMTGTFREPPDKMLRFSKNTNGDWIFHIAEFTDPSLLCEKCMRK